MVRSVSKQIEELLTGQQPFQKETVETGLLLYSRYLCWSRSLFKTIQAVTTAEAVKNQCGY